MSPAASLSVPLAGLAPAGPLDLDLARTLLATLNRALRDAVLAGDGPGRARRPAVREQAVASEDEADIRATLDGDGGAYARLVARHQRAVAQHLLRFTRDAGSLELLVQDTFVEAWNSLAGYRARSPLRPWLLAIATRVGYRHWKERSRRRAETALDALSPAEREQLEHAAPGAGRDAADDPARAAELVHRLLALLSPRDRLVLTLLHLAGLGVAETAELTGWSRTMVKVQAFRARGRLRKLIGTGTRGGGQP